MSSEKKTNFAESFARQLDELQLKIDTLPEEQQPRFRKALAGVVAQHEGMQRQCARIRDMVADIGLTVAHTKFHVEACRREARRASCQGA